MVQGVCVVSEMWYQVFLWTLFSSFLVHTVAAAIACGHLRKHRLGRFVPILIFVMGILSPITGGICTSKSYSYSHPMSLSSAACGKIMFA